jgi:lysophospholipase L1-like esterase
MRGASAEWLAEWKFKPDMKRNEPWLNRAIRKGLRARLLFGIATVTLAATNSPPDEAALCARALVARGDSARLHRQFDRARKGENIVVGVIGGSITQGACASDEKMRYGNLVAAWWREKFPQATVKFVNAGIGATGSDYGALRAQRDLLSQKPDFVIVEYAVNDENQRLYAETLEGLLRQILKQPNQPAVLLLFMMHKDGHNAQEWFVRVGNHYRLPMISYRDPLWAEIQEGRMTWTDISPDVVHPNDRGHAYAAHFVTHVLDQALKNLPTSNVIASVPSLPSPLFTDLFEHVRLIEAAALKPLTNNGWSYDARNQCWRSDQPGSTIEFEIAGTAILAMHYVLRGPMGRARVSVDGANAQELEAWFDQTWGGYRKPQQVARDLTGGNHRVRFELLAEKHAESTGHEFRILGLGGAGK